MIAELKIYEDCSSEEPTAVYTMYRTTTRVSKQMADIQQKYANMQATADNYEEVMQDLDNLLKSIFPKMTDSELEALSVEEKMDFVWAITNHFNQVANRALKN